MFLFNSMAVPLQFEECYQCYSMAVSGRDLEDGDKILLPQSALEILARSVLKDNQSILSVSDLKIG
jgi:hypothetical protein